jgi:hypothetical protein
MGDGNMHWVAAMQKLDGMSTFSAPGASTALASWPWAITSRPARLHPAARSTCRWGLPGSQLHHHPLNCPTTTSRVVNFDWIANSRDFREGPRRLENGIVKIPYLDG